LANQAIEQGNVDLNETAGTDPANADHRKEQHASNTNNNDKSATERHQCQQQKLAMPIPTAEST
jgi:hypothetical protein